MPFAIERAVAESIAKAAAAAIADVAESARQSAVEKPNDQGPVTEADLAADQIIRDGLQAAFPDDLIITEETATPGAEIPQAKRIWFCDPLDGTAEFVKGSPEYSVMLGLVVDGIPVLGVVFEPEPQRLWSAIYASRSSSGASSFECEIGGKRESVIGGSEPPRSAKIPLVIATHGNPGKARSAAYQALGVEQDHVIKRGSAGLKITAVASGEADLYFSGSGMMKVWDTAAPQAILQAAGGGLTNLRGKPLVYHGDAQHRLGLLAGKSLKDSTVDILQRAYARRLENR